MDPEIPASGYTTWRAGAARWLPIVLAAFILISTPFVVDRVPNWGELAWLLLAAGAGREAWHTLRREGEMTRRYWVLFLLSLLLGAQFVRGFFFGLSLLPSQEASGVVLALGVMAWLGRKLRRV